MKRFAVTLTAVAFAFGLTALAANAQTQGAASLHAQAHNFTPLVKQAACGGVPGPFCGPGWTRRCWRGPFGRLHCRCVPC